MRSYQINWTSLQKKENKVQLEILFWGFIILSMFIFKVNPANFEKLELGCYYFQLLILMVIPAYINNYFVLPVFKNKKIALGLLLFFTQIFLLTVSLPYVLNAITHAFKILFAIEYWVTWDVDHVNINIFFATIFASAIHMAHESFTLSQEQKKAELKQLKTQLNPHFLFNTLNNLYGLASTKSDQLPQLMLKLSDLLRYSLYETNHSFVPLDKELLYLHNYIELERIRLYERTCIDFNTSGDFSKHTIAPMLLIAFIENCFKHHNAPRNQQGFIEINIKMQGKTLAMKVKNSLDPLLVTTEKEMENGGIGLTNAKKRLELIYFQKFSLEVEQQPEYYLVNLKIELTHAEVKELHYS